MQGFSFELLSIRSELLDFSSDVAPFRFESMGFSSGMSSEELGFSSEVLMR